MTTEESEIPKLENLPIQEGLIEKALQALNSWEITPEQVAALFAEDPVLAVTVLSEANKKEGTTICSLEGAVRAMNRDRLIDLLQRSSNQCKSLVPELQKPLDAIREKARLTAKIAQILTGKLAAEYEELSLTCGTLLFVGEILGLVKEGAKFAYIAQSRTKREELRQEIQNQLDLSLAKLEITFLQECGIPAEVSPLLPADISKATDTMRLTTAICLSAVELVELFRSGQLKECLSSKNSPVASSIEQLLPDPEIREDILKNVYEELSGAPLEKPPAKKKKKTIVKAVPPPGKIDTKDIDTTVEYDVESSTPVMIVSPDGSKEVQGVAPPEIPTVPERQVQEIIKEITEIIETNSDTTPLVTLVMDRLVKQIFQRCALIEISDEERIAFAITVRGSEQESAEEVEFSNPLSPLLRKSSTVQSFASAPKDCSPFGSKAFALAPLDARHSRPIALYADCGQDVILNLAARTVFRSIVELLNDKLPETTGKLPDHEE